MDLREYLRANPSQGFNPLPVFSKDGDQLRWYWSDEEGYADPIYHKGVHIGSLIRSFKTREVVGVKIHGIIGLVKEG